MKRYIKASYKSSENDVYSVYIKDKHYGDARSLEGAKNIAKYAYKRTFENPEDIVVYGPNGFSDDMYGLFEFERYGTHQILKED